ncbi:MAG: T9SS type A sorting domain-containing protein [Paludibacter sp.]|nr:T9SS type A sorting domain-containing protein [Paludibacter sp.]
MMKQTHLLLKEKRNLLLSGFLTLTFSCLFSIEMQAQTQIFSQDFSAFEAVNQEITPAILQSILPDWEGNNIHLQVAGGNNRLRIGSEVADTAFIKLPAIDLSQPFHIGFGFRNRNGDNPIKTMDIMLDDTKLIWHGSKSGTTFSTYETEAFVGTTTSRITFTVPKTENSSMMIDDVIIYQTNKPALNIAWNETVEMGKINPSGNKTINIPVKGYNLASDLTLSLVSGQHFQISSGTTVTQTDATNGTNISILFTAPVNSGLYTDSLYINSADFSTRKVYVEAMVEETNAVPEIPAANISITNHQITLTNYPDNHLLVYNTSGMLVKEIKLTRHSETIILPEKGAFILQLKSGKQSMTRKVIIQ